MSDITKDGKIKFRKYNPPSECPKPLIEGRVVSKWLLDNAHRISEEDFYNPELTEDDLRRKYGDPKRSEVTPEISPDLQQEAEDTLLLLKQEEVVRPCDEFIRDELIRSFYATLEQDIRSFLKGKYGKIPHQDEMRKRGEFIMLKSPGSSFPDVLIFKWDREEVFRRRIETKVGNDKIGMDKIGMEVWDE